MWKHLTKSDAEKIILSWNENEIPVPSCEENMLNLRDEIINASNRANQYIKVNEQNSNKQDYLYDLRFGLELYLLLEENYNFNERQASDDTIWIYLSIRVVPDLVYNRWGLNEGRFFKQTRRIWLRTIWWYIHLSWTSSKHKTYEMLKKFTTDEIAQLVERSGPKGYRIDVTREIMMQFSSLNGQHDRNLFRKIMKLNTARLKIVEPSLINGGTKKYVKELIDYFGQAKNSFKEKEDMYTTSS